MFVCAMHFEKPAVYVCRNLFLLGGYVSVDADVKMGIDFMVAMPVLAHGYVVKKVGEPEEVISFTDHPVEVDAPVVICEGACSVGMGGFLFVDEIGADASLTSWCFGDVVGV